MAATRKKQTEAKRYKDQARRLGDLIENPETEHFIHRLLEDAPFLRHTPILFVSALLTEGMDKPVDVRFTVPLKHKKNRGDSEGESADG